MPTKINPTEPGSDSEIEDEDDPIIESYDVFVRPALSNDRQGYVLQFPNRHAAENYCADLNTLPLQMRIKPEAKMVELDVPINANENYDKKKGIDMGEALNKSNSSKGSGSHGLAGGFGIGGQQSMKGKLKDEEDIQRKILEDWNVSVEAGKVLNKLTLGGQAIADEDVKPVYMLGTFRNGQLHLVPVTSIVQLSSQLHHIDAQAEQERINRGRENGLGIRTQEARAVHMTVKSSYDEDDSESNEKPMIDRIAAAQGEKWKGLKFVDEESNIAWMVYSEEMFAGNSLALSDDEAGDLKFKLPTFTSSMTGEEYLDEISAPRKLTMVDVKTEEDEIASGKGKRKAKRTDFIESDIEE